MDINRRLDQGPLRVRPLWSDAQTEQLAGKVLERRRKRALVRSGVSALALGAVLGGAWLTMLEAPATRALAVKPAPALQAPAPLQRLELSDGSAIQLTREASQLRLIEQSESRVLLGLHSGGAEFDVRPDPKRIFQVDAGPVHVRVLGTAFGVTLENGRARVAVQRGAVEVSWAGGKAELRAGNSGLFPPAEWVSNVPVETPPPTRVAAKTAEPPAKVAPRSDSNDLPVWRELAASGEYNAAYEAIEQRERDTIQNEPSDLMLAADVARLSRHPAEAVLLLERVARDFPNDPRAPLAAFTLGRVLLEDLGRAAAAADAFRRAHELAPGGPLASDALARAVEALERSGQAEPARAAARRYLELFPTGRHANQLRERLNEVPPR